MSLREFELRAARIRNEMDANNLDVALIYQDSRRWAWGDFSYISNSVLVGPEALVILPRDGAPVLLVTTKADLELAKDMSLIEDVRVTKDLTLETSEVLKSMKLANKSIGLVGIPMTRFENEFPQGKVVNTPMLLVKPWMVKTDLEIGFIRKAAELCDIGFQKALDVAKVGMAEYELMAAIEYEMRLNGMNDQGPFLMASGPHTYMMYGATDRKLEKGDILNFEITPSYKGYFLQICRTAIMGPISEKRRKAYECSLKAIEASEAVMKPGVEVRELCIMQNDILKSVVSFKRYRRGHMFGHGMDLRKGCQIEMENNIKMEKNMVFTVHPNQYNPDFGYMALGCPVIVTDDGIEHLTKHTHELVSIPC